MKRKERLRTVAITLCIFLAGIGYVVGIASVVGFVYSLSQGYDILSWLLLFCASAVVIAGSTVLIWIATGKGG